MQKGADIRSFFVDEGIPGYKRKLRPMLMLEMP
jgi:hypothetical protein